jgi:hypothetical protein
MRDYLRCADEHEFFVKHEGAEIDQDKKIKLEDLGNARTSAHNLLIAQLNQVAFELRGLGIDNNLIRDIIGEDRKLSKDESDRRPVEHWARSLARYFATVAETTKEG